MDSFIKKLLGECPIEYIALDGEMRIVRLSERADLFGDNPERVVVGADIREAFPEFVGMENDLAVIAATRLGEWQVRNISRINRRGFSITIDVSVQPAITQTNEKLVVLIEDVTERSKLEQKLVQQSNETKLLLATVTATRNYYEKIIESISDALFVLSPNGTIRTLNATVTKLLGYHKGELSGIPIGAVLVFEQALSFSEPAKNIVGTARTKSGDDIPVAVSTSILDDECADDKQVIFLARDLREKRQAEFEIGKLQAEKTYLLEEIQETHNFQEIVGKSKTMMKIFKQMEQVAQTDSTVLLLGETGTGKELIAHAIHRLSKRNTSVLVKVNCAALPAGLVESELFGHEKGAFTGANARRIGRFEHANGGTILLDELAELPLDTQSKLLRVLQEREFERVGGTHPLHVDVRVIASTNQNLEEAVSGGKFRSDLFFRLNVFPIVVPPLRERREDIPLLVKFFVKKFSQRMNKEISTIEKKTSESLLQYDWPGNIRELAAVIERAVILTDGEVLNGIDVASSSGKRIHKHKSATLEEVERDHILATLKAVDNIIEGPKGAALRLGINPSTLRSRMRKLGIRRQGTSYH